MSWVFFRYRVNFKPFNLILKTELNESKSQKSQKNLEILNKNGLWQNELILELIQEGTSACHSCYQQRKLCRSQDKTD